MTRHMRRAARMAALLVAAGIATSASAAVCKKVKFSFRNDSADAIRVEKIVYWDDSDSKWRTENVKDVECSPGDPCTTSGDDLGTIVDGVQLHHITEIHYYHRHLIGSTWGSLKYATYFPPSPDECSNYRTYGRASIK